ncbi:glycosyl hydrolase, partial [Alteromonas sp.]|nr:glycosyl hydrolase [Alteromonas sp.]
VSQHDPKTVYYGTQMILKTTDRGVNWQEISPDLTRNESEKQGLNGGPITNEQAGAEYYNTVFYIAESPVNAGELWVGADDGQLHLTQNEGESWKDITPHKTEAQVNAIELSVHAEGRAYVAVTGYKLNDYRPYIYKTDNYGKRWTRIDKGLPDDAFVRVIREDKTHEGILFAGTESGIFISFDDGKNWQALSLNLPPVAITDMQVKGDDLVIATQGRGFWILDDITPLREVSASLHNEALFQYRPVDGIRLLSGGNMSGQPEAKNPARGATFRYYLKDQLEDSEALRIDIFDANDTLVRTLSSTGDAFEKCAKGNEDVRNPLTFKHPSTKAGYNEFVWDLRRSPLQCIDNVKLFGGWNGARVMPGEYKATISIGDTSQTRAFTVLPDPREETDAAQLHIVEQSIKASEALLNELFEHLQKARNVRDTLKGVSESNVVLASEVSASIDRIISAIDDWESLVIQPKHQTFEDDINWPNMLDRQVRFLMDNFDRTGAPAQAGALKRLEDLETRWQQYKVQLESLFQERVKPVNEALSKQGAYDLDTL